MFPWGGYAHQGQGGFERQFNNHAGSPPSHQYNISSPNGAIPPHHASHDGYGTPPSQMSGIRVSQHISPLQQQLQRSESQLPTHVHGHPAQTAAPPHGMQWAPQPYNVNGLLPTTSTATMAEQAAMSGRPIAQNLHGLTKTQTSVLPSISQYEGPESYPTAVQQHKRGIKRTVEDDVDELTHGQSRYRQLAPKTGGATASRQPTSQVNGTLSSSNSRPSSATTPAEAGVLSLDEEDFELTVRSASDTELRLFPRVPLDIPGASDDVDCVKTNAASYVRGFVRAIDDTSYLSPSQLERRKALTDTQKETYVSWQDKHYKEARKILQGEHKLSDIFGKDNMKGRSLRLASGC
jgi:hypothetical protein